MTLTEISHIRLISQKIAMTDFKSAPEIVRWMGAMQAQDYSMAIMAIGLRLSNSGMEEVESAMNSGEIIRTHLMRPTWHFVSAENLYPILELTAPKIRASLKSRHKQLELSEPLISKSKHIIEEALLKETYLTREELAAKFGKANIKTDNNRLSHLMLCAELDGIACSGPLKNNKQTYALLCKRVPRTKNFNRDESLAMLAKRYFTSHCPATLNDFVWWSGLSVTDARKALDFVKPGFISETIGSDEYWFPNSFSNAGHNKPSVHLLPAYDEFLISYKDRKASLLNVDNKKAISNNGVFHPVIVVDGQVAGTWKRTIKKDTVIIELTFFRQPTPLTKKLLEEKIYEFGGFS